MKKRQLITIIAACLLMCVVLFVSNTNSEAAEWRQKGTKWQYVKDNGKVVKKKWKEIDGRWYYFDKKGYMVTGLQTIGGKKYYFAPKTKGSWRIGQRMYGWQLVDGKYMYFSINGEYLPECSSYESGTIKGIDVSQYQGSMNWSKAKKQGIEFAIIRVGHGKHNVDPYFNTNMINANAVGIKTGIYFYSTAKTESASRKDAQWVIQQLRGHNVTYPVALDMEDNSQISLGRTKITKIAKAFLDEIAAAGYTPMIYLNENWAINYVDLSKLPGVYRWVARYNGSFNTSISRDIWQAGSTVLLDGIDVNSVDIDFCYRDFSKIVTPRTKPISSYKTHVKGFKKCALGIWYDKGDGTFPYSCWMTIGDKTYYFNDEGYLTKGWLKTTTGIYFLNDDGTRAESQWITDDGLYYCGKDGRLVTGWNDINGKTYYMNAIGKVQTGWVEADDGIYYLNLSGTLVRNKWITYEGDKYYITSDGKPAVGEYVVDGKTYVFDDNGVLLYEAENKPDQTDETNQSDDQNSNDQTNTNDTTDSPDQNQMSEQ
ncbi:MAG: cell wall-binding protein [Eubacterium sp.]|nr:cell wall-binding protein [Eubacterium sp.]